MILFFPVKKIVNSSPKGFVLPFTLFLVSLMIVITTNVSSVLTHQLYFSKVSRQSQTAYYAADNALACALTVDDTYVSGTHGIFPWDTQGQSPLDSSITNPNTNLNIQNALSDTNTQRALQVPALSPLSLSTIKCAQNAVLNASPAVEDFTISPTPVSVPTTPPEQAVVSSFKMRMPLGDGTFRCAKVTVVKSDTYRQVIAQGYALCGRYDGTVERAVVNTTITQ